ncbi:hypothetical protein SAMN05421858_5093 [Haladaptatus litoreus]|uniref:Uncharacterized protein n=1 Tax=Haladaptatus litoreus TaxID=553468 RepID=A0A1N7FI24_9EURY|nr:hypothetical protein [Haladaptatus litoreus]SIS00078.1 hypothetical protein SAMN05421858_5093 [Haladaptatus litoreus]
MSATDYTTMDRQLPGGRFQVFLKGIEFYFEKIDGSRARLFEAVDSETGDAIPLDAVEVPDRVISTLEMWGYDYVELDDVESLEEAM